MPLALVRPPSPRLADGIVTHIDRQPVDAALAHHQWQRYVDTMAEHGWTIVPVPAADELPDGVFIEDALVMFGDTAVITRPGDPARAPEPGSVEPVIRSLGARVAPLGRGFLDGGDVLKVGSTVYVGRGGRTDDEGIAALGEIVNPLGYHVVTVPLTKVLHLKSAITALPDGTIVGWPDALDDPSVFAEFLAVPEESGAHVVLLGEQRLLMAADAPRSAELFASMGYEPVQVDIGEFTKLEGCVTCLSVRVRVDL